MLCPYGSLCSTQLSSLHRSLIRIHFDHSTCEFAYAEVANHAVIQGRRWQAFGGEHLVKVKLVCAVPDTRRPHYERELAAAVSRLQCLWSGSE